MVFRSEKIPECTVLYSDLSYWQLQQLLMISSMTQGYFVTLSIYKYLITAFKIVNVAIMYVAMQCHTANTLEGSVKSIVVPVQLVNAAAVWLGNFINSHNYKDVPHIRITERLYHACDTFVNMIYYCLCNLIMYEFIAVIDQMCQLKLHMSSEVLANSSFVKVTP